jgi:hypothetical protein
MMNFTFHNQRGEAVKITDPAAFKAFVDAGQIQADTLLQKERIAKILYRFRL